VSNETRAALGSQIRPEFRSPPQAQATQPRRYLASRRGRRRRRRQAALALRGRLGGALNDLQRSPGGAGFGTLIAVNMPFDESGSAYEHIQDLYICAALAARPAIALPDARLRTKGLRSTSIMAMAAAGTINSCATTSDEPPQADGGGQSPAIRLASQVHVSLAGS